MKRLFPAFLTDRPAAPSFKRAGTVLCAAAVWLASAVQLPAAFEENGTGARARAMAGAFTAVADNSETLFIQPAGLALLDMTGLSLTYGKLLAGLSDGSEMNDGAAAVCMPVCRQCGIGIGYKNTGLSTAYREETVVAGGAWHPLSFIAAGAAVKYLRVKYGQDEYTAADPVFASGYEKAGIDFDAGILLKLSPYFKLAWARQNLAGADLGLREKAAVTAADHLGLTYSEDSFTMTVESVKIEDCYRYLSAVEKWFLRKTLAVRFGFGWGDRDFRKAAAGLGVSFDRFTIDYALEYPLSGLEQISGTHYVTLSARFSGSRQKEDGAATTEVAVSTVPAAITVELPAVSSSTVPVPGNTEEVFYGPVSSVTCTAAEVEESSAALKAQIADFLLHLDTAPAAVVPDKPAAPVARQKPEGPAQAVAVKKKAAHKEAPAAGEPRPPARGQELLTHRVAAGDTLPGLAERYYGRKTLWMKIYDANRDRIEKGALRPGDILIIPPAED